MNNISFYDENFKNSNTYKKFISENPKLGYLKIRAYMANEAIPVKGLKVVISKIIDNNNVIFFDGVTSDSGMIEKIGLPTPELNPDNLDIPSKTTYSVLVSYNNKDLVYEVNMYENVCTLQVININPNINMGG